MYNYIKHDIQFEKSLFMINDRLARILFTKFRGSCLSLQVELGRRINVVREKRVCKVCFCDVEHEKHFFFECLEYDRDRIVLFDSLCELDDRLKCLNFRDRIHFDRLLSILFGTGIGVDMEGVDKEEEQYIMKQGFNWVANYIKCIMSKRWHILNK